MNLTEIKKELYKQKPEANLLYIRMGNAYYDTVIDDFSEEITKYKTVFFCIPVSDMGEVDFEPTMPAKLLNRWIVDPVEAGISN